MNMKSKNLVCAMNESMRTILQVTKHTAGVPRQMLAKLRLFRVCFKTVYLASVLLLIAVQWNLCS